MSLTIRLYNIEDGVEKYVINDRRHADWKHYGIDVQDGIPLEIRTRVKRGDVSWWREIDMLGPTGMKVLGWVAQHRRALLDEYNGIIDVEPEQKSTTSIRRFLATTFIVSLVVAGGIDVIFRVVQ